MEASRLIEKAAVWSPESHELFPRAARKWAVEVMRIGPDCLGQGAPQRRGGGLWPRTVGAACAPNVVARPH